MNRSNAGQHRAVHVVARIWLLEHGCRYFHTAHVSADDSHAWLEQVSQDAVSFSGIHECRVGSTKAYRVLIRVPDPNNAERNVTNVWLLVDPKNQLTLAHVQKFAEAPYFAAGSEEFEAWVHARLDQAAIPMGFSSGSPATQKTLRRPVFRAMIGIGFISIALFALGYWSWSGNSVEDASETEADTETLKTPDARWDNDDIRNEMRLALENANVVDGSARDLDDMQLLTKFVELFRIRDDELNLSEADLKAMDQRRTMNLPHPFLIFIDQFPKEIPQISLTEGASWSGRCSSALIPLANHFRNAVEGETSASRSVDDMNPREIIAELRRRLDYTSVYDTWQKTSPTSKKTDPFLLSWDSDDPALSWQSGVREFLKEHFHPQ